MAETSTQALIAEAEVAAKFYAERWVVDEQKRIPSLEEMSRREALDQAILLRRLAAELSRLSTLPSDDQIEASAPAPPVRPSTQTLAFSESQIEAAARAAIDALVALPISASSSTTERDVRRSRRGILLATIDWDLAMRAALAELSRLEGGGAVGGTVPTREEIARVIDSDAFEMAPGTTSFLWPGAFRDREDALAKANTILALISAPSGEG